MGARLQRRPRRAATAASPPRTINATSSTHPRMAVLPRAPPRAHQPGKVIAVDGSRGGWAVDEGPGGLWAVPARSWRAPLTREALGEPCAGSPPAFRLVCLGAESSSHASVALWVCRLRRAEIGDTPAQALGLFSPARTPWRGRGFQGQVSPCPSLFVLHGQTAPGPHPLPHRVLPHAGVLLAEGFGLSVLRGLFVEFHFFSVG